MAGLFDVKGPGQMNNQDIRPFIASLPFFPEEMEWKLPSFIPLLDGKIQQSSGPCPWEIPIPFLKLRPFRPAKPRREAFL
jgi:hypothetical protein